MRLYRMMVDVPFMPKGREFWFDDDTGNVYAVLDGEVSQYSLRPGLANYLWLLLTGDGDVKYLEKMCSCNAPGFDANCPSVCPACGEPHAIAEVVR